MPLWRMDSDNTDSKSLVTLDCFKCAVILGYKRKGKEYTVLECIEPKFLSANKTRHFRH